MIDLILFATILAAFYAGFKTGNSFKTMGEAVDALKNKLK